MKISFLLSNKLQLFVVLPQVSLIFWYKLDILLILVTCNLSAPVISLPTEGLDNAARCLLLPCSTVFKYG
jgi:hypothetical protein